MSDAAAEANRELIRRFYDALDSGDAETMAAMYKPDGTFEDPAFGKLSGAEAGQMWRMLASRGSDLSVELPEHDATADTGTAHWIATYTFGDTGRKVVNDIQARFRFEDGLIAEHVDSFSFYRWSSQALGPVGRLLGWTPMLHSTFQRKARERLAAFTAGD